MLFVKKNFLLTVTVFFLALLTGCGSNGEVFSEAEKYISTIREMDIPDDVRIIGLGEATHGNIELQELKKDVFAALIENENVRVFVLEGDFGGGQQINQFILNGIGTAEEAVNALDYGIYRTEQMIDLVQWMHNYNTKVSEDEKVYFYGNDMQRYDFSKKGLLDYYKIVNLDKAEKYTELLKHVSNDTMRELTSKQLIEIDEIVDNIILDLKSNEKVYVEQSSVNTYAFSLQYAQILKQRTQLFLNEKNYVKIRDQYLADNLQWIVEFEATQGHDKVFISGHNGHIEKTSASLAGYKSMGNYLDELYGSDYFAIGTDLIKSKFQAFNSGSNERKIYEIESHNDLVDAFSEMEPNIFYIGFKKASESKDLLDIITREQKMLNIGDDFSSWYKLLKKFYTIEMIPKEAYDGVILIKEATPTTVID
ncbi:erythromycin esterase family protein [Metabacillus fastidiosus]|uniref:erythromycin esterase family protein n=1 Tax=Metabacillus fastidiosus TaxID=1458 RepID=UPI002E1E53F2|nr:erythromycin esterase family protein [Metabacillus fastidiosus]